MSYSSYHFSMFQAILFSKNPISQLLILHWVYEAILLAVKT